MSRISNLLQEMQEIFGQSFGSEVNERQQRPMPRSNPSPRGLLSKSKDFPSKSGMSDKVKAFRAKAKEKEKAKEDKPKETAPAGTSGKSQSKKGSSSGSVSKSGQRHSPFKRNSNLGPGPRGAHHDQTKCWNCKCGNVYNDGCNCVASGRGENCPDKGTTKKISYTKSYKRDYNNEYHAWRAKQGGAVTKRIG
jgi:hypothetical protein